MSENHTTSQRTDEVRASKSIVSSYSDSQSLHFVCFLSGHLRQVCFPKFSNRYLKLKRWHF